MKRVLLYVAFSFLPALAGAQGTPTFESRVNAAKELEGQTNVWEYLKRHLIIPVMMSADTSNVLAHCVALPGASKTDFTIVADITSDGSITNVAVKPASDTARCFANYFGTLRLSPPPGAYSSGLPVFIEMGLGG
jgi:hypothetical protein